MTNPDSILSGDATICLDYDLVTAVALTSQHAHPIAVLGTSKGYVLKVNLEVNRLTHLYSAFFPVKGTSACKSKFKS